MAAAVATPPGELALWERRFRTHPPGDHLTHILLAKIGYKQDLAHFGKADPEDWFWWAQPSTDLSAKARREEITEEDHDQARQLLLNE